MTRALSRTVTVATTPDEVFAMLADARRHAEVDGSGTVRGDLKAPPRLALGSRFSMRMRMGLPYRMTLKVTEFTEGRRIAWRHPAHHVWRWELEPVAGGTAVTETFEWEHARLPAAYELLGLPARNANGITASLANLVERFGTPEDPAEAGLGGAAAEQPADG